MDILEKVLKSVEMVQFGDNDSKYYKLDLLCINNDSSWDSELTLYITEELAKSKGLDSETHALSLMGKKISIMGNLYLQQTPQVVDKESGTARIVNKLKFKVKDLAFTK